MRVRLRQNLEVPLDSILKNEINCIRNNPANPPSYENQARTLLAISPRLDFLNPWARLAFLLDLPRCQSAAHRDDKCILSGLIHLSVDEFRCIEPHASSDRPCFRLRIIT